LEGWTRHGGHYEVLDKEVYTCEKDMGLFYQENKFYVYGSVGFYVIQSEPFHVTLLINPEVDLSSPEYKYLSKALAKYTAEQAVILHSTADLEERDQLFYEQLSTPPIIQPEIFYTMPLKRDGTINYRKILLYPFS